MYMGRYLNTTFDWRRPEIANCYDEMPLWTAQFGRMLLEHFPIARYERVLDVAFGTGFPILDIAQRLGVSCKAYGIDPWTAAVARARQKAETLRIDNVTLIEGDAISLPFPDAHFDLVTSNLGLNNMDDPQAVLREIHRVMRLGAAFCTTSNLNGTFAQFYEVFEATLHRLGHTDKLPAFAAHVTHRGTVASLGKWIEDAGLRIRRTIEDSFDMRFLDGSAFLNHAFTMVGFIAPWLALFDETERPAFFAELEADLNTYAAGHGELRLTVPMVYFEAVK